MKTSKERGQKYAAEIDKALRRAAQRAELTAAVTGTRLVIYEKGRIRRVPPPLKLKTPRMKMMRGMRTKLARHSREYSHLNLEELQAGGEYTAVAEKGTKYSSK